MTHSLVLWAEEMLRNENVEHPKMEAQLLLGYVLDLSRSQIIAEMFEPISPQDLIRFRTVVDRRARGESLATIRGFKEFYSHKFFVNKSVLIPRPETEILVEQAISLAQNGEIVGDICTGSGCIAMSIALSRSDLKLVAADISVPALEVACINRNSFNLKCQVQLVKSDLCNALRSQSLSVIISNPPYIETEQIKSLQREIRLFEPGIALDGGEDGLYYYRKLANEGRRCLKAGGRILLEVGDGQSETVMNLLRCAGFLNLHSVPDLSGIQRVVVGQLSS